MMTHGPFIYQSMYLGLGPDRLPEPAGDWSICIWSHHPSPSSLNTWRGLPAYEVYAFDLIKFQLGEIRRREKPYVFMEPDHFLKSVINY